MRTAKNILIIDDEPRLCASLGEIIASSFPSAHIFCTVSPHEALDFIYNNKVDIAVIDLMMPLIKGFEILEVLKTKQPESHAFIMTGYGDQASLSRAIGLGAEKFIQKPFDPQMLLNLLEAS